MAKAHEQTLSVHPLDSRVVINEEGLVVADIREPLSGEGREFSALFAAAPDMARALLLLLDFEPTTDLRFIAAPVLRDARAALKKAGVLP